MAVQISCPGEQFVMPQENIQPLNGFDIDPTTFNNYLDGTRLDSGMSLEPTDYWTLDRNSELPLQTETNTPHHDQQNIPLTFIVWVTDLQIERRIAGVRLNTTVGNLVAKIVQTFGRHNLQTL